VLIGLLAGIVPYITVTKLKAMLGFDDSLDAFGIHGVGGTLGALLTGILASPETNGGITDLVAQGGLVMEQIKSIGVTLVLSVVGSAIIAYIVKAVVGLRPSQEVERQGLDINEHGEEGYIL
jgi:Amt family ammonium transporter